MKIVLYRRPGTLTFTPQKPSDGSIRVSLPDTMTPLRHSPYDVRAVARLEKWKVTLTPERFGLLGNPTRIQLTVSGTVDDPGLPADE